MSPTPPWTPNIILFWALVVIFNHLGGVGTIFRFLKSESFSKRSYTPKSVAFGRIRGFSKRLIFLNSDLDTQNDLKPTIIQYNICCTYKKRLDYVVRSEKKWKGGQKGSGKGKNRSKKGSFDPKTAKFGPKCAFLVILGQILAFSALFVPCPTKKQPTFTFFTSNNLVWTFLIYTTFWVSKTDLKKRADFRLAVFHQKRREWGDTIRHKTAHFSKIKKPNHLKWLMIMFRA